ncbi:NUDIX hydrolase [Microlunatus speluncae]|uniref:NUDIX hydrolase n=1 Tax=Microlunatus speluncae TaxID=2594267 RepID=UPI0013758D96|nr:NUDIX domain-containing protein [Microlunatus speluncae]
MYVRRAARVVLLNPADEVLLLRSRFRSEIPGLEWAWFVPGGGLEPGESVGRAAVRELAEETGIELDEERLVPIAYAEGFGTLGTLSGPMRDDFFLARVAESRVSTDAMAEYERAALGDHRWWPLPELVRTDQPIVPGGLAGLLVDYLAAPEWSRPRSLPW